MGEFASSIFFPTLGYMVSLTSAPFFCTLCRVEARSGSIKSCTWLPPIFYPKVLSDVAALGTPSTTKAKGILFTLWITQP